MAMTEQDLETLRNQKLVAPEKQTRKRRKQETPAYLTEEEMGRLCCCQPSQHFVPDRLWDYFQPLPPLR
jgi:hypothetical protein